MIKIDSQRTNKELVAFLRGHNHVHFAFRSHAYCNFWPPKSRNTENSHWQAAPLRMNEWTHCRATSRNVTFPVLSQNTADENQSAAGKKFWQLFVQTFKNIYFFPDRTYKTKIHIWQPRYVCAFFFLPDSKCFKSAKSTYFLASPLSGIGCRLRNSKGEEQTVGKHRGLPWCKTLKSRVFIYLYIYLLHASQKKVHNNTRYEYIAWTYIQSSPIWKPAV